MIKSKFLPDKLIKYASDATILSDMEGVVSGDRSAVVGKNGWCYIYEGSNDYRSGYINENFFLLGGEWAHIIEARQRTCDELGVQFLQVLVPNKVTLIPEFFPEPLTVDISYSLKGILNVDINANILVPIAEFRADGVRESIFRRNDSHLTVAGNAYLTELILINLGLNDFNSVFVETQQLKHVGDLGGKFEQVISEALYIPTWSKGLLNLQGVNKINDVTSVNFNGIEQVFVNSNAPINKKIMVIGNSFFERVPSWGLSPFFSSLFSDYSFIWSPNFDVSRIKEYAPDIVISQTCERFLSKLPTDLH